MLSVDENEKTLLNRDAYLAWIEVDTAAVVHNLQLLRGLLKGRTRVFGVVKADAYGHGAVKVARALEEAGVDTFCVARVEEAVELRNAGIRGAMLVFTPAFRPQAMAAIGVDSALSVGSKEHAEQVASAARACGRRARIHMKVDIGMGRLGTRPENAVELLRFISTFPELEVEGIFSHFPCADMQPPTITRKQIETFASMRQAVLDAGFKIPYFHCANSAAAMDFPEAHFDAVRLGIALYGQYPSSEVQARLALKPAMALKTTIVFVKDVPAGVGLSYGHTFVTSRPSKIATVSLGYADGYPRHASSRTAMLVHGHPAPVLGRVCMDQILLDVTDIPETGLGDEVLVFGASGGYALPADALAAAIGTIGYEITTRVGKRLPRFYP